jgi:hypothetical protein
LSIGDNEGSESAQTLKRLITVSLRGFLIDGSIGRGHRLGVELLCLPNEILQEVAIVLGQQEVFGLCHYVPDIIHKLPSIG